MKLRSVTVAAFLYLLIWPPSVGDTQPIVHHELTYKEKIDSLESEKNNKLQLLNTQEETIKIFNKLWKERK